MEEHANVVVIQSAVDNTCLRVATQPSLDAAVTPRDHTVGDPHGSGCVLDAVVKTLAQNGVGNADDRPDLQCS